MEINNMATILYNGEEISKKISDEIENAPDFNTCMDLANKYWCTVYPSCNEVIRTRLFDLCFKGRIIELSNAFRYCYFIEKTEYRTQYLNTIFHDFTREAQLSYLHLNELEKELYIIKETRDYWENINSFNPAVFMFKHTADRFPELKELMIEKLFALCYKKDDNLSTQYASDFITAVGKENRYSRFLLNSFLKHSAIFLIISVLVCVGSILIMTKLSVPGWSFILWTPLALAFGSMGIQYLFKTISALSNYGKTKDFNFDTGVFAYQKGVNGYGHYKRENNFPMKKPNLK